MSISLNMITGSFEEPFLEAALESAAVLCDKFIIVDTYPGNNPNIETIKNVCDKLEMPLLLVEYPRENEENFSFGKARQMALDNTETDIVLRLDADEVLREEDGEYLKKLAEDKLNNNYVGIEISFYHHMVYPYLYQFIEKKVMLFKKDKANWTRKVHERLNLKGDIFKYHEVKYHHYGYCRGQREVFKRWKLYKDIEEDYTWYDNDDPDNIITDRISVSHKFRDKHPSFVEPKLEEIFGDIYPFVNDKTLEVKMGYDTNVVGLLIITYNDEKYLKEALESLEKETRDSVYPIIIRFADMGSTDKTHDIISEFRLKVAESEVIIETHLDNYEYLESLADTMNDQFRKLLERTDCKYIGWYHPDMVSENSWLNILVTKLDNPNIGKACAFNTRDEKSVFEAFDGQEQAYLIRADVLKEIGLFDSGFKGIGGYEDWDMNNRIKQSGYKVMIFPDAKVFHYGMKTRERRDTSKEQIMNGDYYYKKWGTRSER